MCDYYSDYNCDRSYTGLSGGVIAAIVIIAIVKIIFWIFCIRRCYYRRTVAVYVPAPHMVSATTVIQNPNQPHAQTMPQGYAQPPPMYHQPPQATMMQPPPVTGPPAYEQKAANTVIQSV